MLSKPKPRLLCAWEQGSNLGHLSNLRLPIEIALQLGYEVFVAARELSRAPEVLGSLPVTYLQAPFKQNVVPADHRAFQSYTHLILRQCFSTPVELEMLVRAWRGLFDVVRPDVVMFEHAPTALVASHAYGFKKVLVGSGFTVPPVEEGQAGPFLPFITTPRSADVMAALHADDALLLALINTALARVCVPQLPSLARIYAQADQQFLMTLPQLDQFGERSGQHYLGVGPTSAQPAPSWPPGSGPKVYGYLQHIPSLEKLLQDLLAAGVCALLLVRNVPPELKRAYTSDQMHFSDTLVDLNQVAKDADWVINHANTTTATVFVKAGIPQLLIPRHQEQLFVALRVVNHGGAVLAYQDQPGFAKEINALMTKTRYRECAVQLQVQCVAAGSKDAADFIRQSFHALLPRS
jgi:hypothetical protein